MHHEGPPLEALLHRLTDTPEDFLADPRIEGEGAVHVAAVIADCVARWGELRQVADLESFRVGDRAFLGVALVLAWLLHDPGFEQWDGSPAAALKAIDTTARELAPFVSARRFVEDPDRREELARFLLARLDLRPAGESENQAKDRLMTISTVERKRVLKAAREAEQRARAIREQLARKRAKESADKYMRE